MQLEDLSPLRDVDGATMRTKEECAFCVNLTDLLSFEWCAIRLKARVTLDRRPVNAARSSRLWLAALIEREY
jgi:hypothetical protein